ncbi:hypothetical protein Pelo_11285 [Pelomyxa schiedti]|nr:hypothetical protein Pelo_11285 [Pelomyxa schiedti]
MASLMLNLMQASGNRKTRLSRDTLSSGVDYGIEAEPPTPLPVGAEESPIKTELPRLWEERVLRWIGNANELAEPGDWILDIKTWYPNVLIGPCTDGNLEVVKWMVGGFCISELWELVVPLNRALSNGMLEIAQWLFEKFDLKHRLPSGTLSEFADTCAMSKNPSSLQWYVQEMQVPITKSLFYAVLRNEYGTANLCQWIKEKIKLISLSPYSCAPFKSVDVFKWVELNCIFYSPSRLSKVSMDEICEFVADARVLEWFITEKHYAPTSSTFIVACSKPEDDPTILKLISHTVDLSPSDLRTSLEVALGQGCISIANWLNDTYHVMEQFIDYTTAVSSLTTICHRPNNRQYQADGVDWFLKHMPVTNSFVEIPSHTSDLLRATLTLCCANTFFLVLKTFSFISLDRYPKEWEKGIEHMLTWSLWDVIHLSSLVALPVEPIVRCLTSPDCSFVSSKVVKWLIKQFHLEAGHIKNNHNCLLYKLLNAGFSACAEWLIDSFCISFDEILDMVDHWKRERIIFYLKLAPWKMLLNKFHAQIDPIMLNKLMELVCCSPYHIAASLKSLRWLTMEQIRNYCRDAHNLQTTTSLWYKTSAL